jgi:hypothetical protein
MQTPCFAKIEDHNPIHVFFDLCESTFERVFRLHREHLTILEFAVYQFEKAKSHSKNSSQTDQRHEGHLPPESKATNMNPIERVRHAEIDTKSFVAGIDAKSGLRVLYKRLHLVKSVRGEEIGWSSTKCPNGFSWRLG